MSLDDELLMLAGEDSDEDAPQSAPSSPKKRARPTPKRSRKKARRDSHSDGSQTAHSDDDALSDEDSYASSADAPMDLNGSGSDEDDEDDVKDLYPLEGKYKDMADKESLLAMTEVDREAVLADRAATLERAHQDRQLRNLLRSRNEGAAATAAGLRKSARTKSEPKKSAEATKRGKLDELKRTREERKAGGGQKALADEDASRRMLDDDDEVGGFVEDSYVKEEREIEVTDMNRCLIGRTGFGKLCDYPNFQETVTDCFVRLSLHDKETNRPVYRVAQIKGFTKGKPYSMLDGTRRTDLHLHLCQGKAERSFPMDMMSDGKITDSEFNRFKAQLLTDRVPLPTLSLLQRKSRDLRALDAKTLTPAEIDALIRKRTEGKLDPVTLLARRGDLNKKREYALAKGDEEEVERIEKELQEIEDNASSRPVGRQESQMERMARINAKNRKKNMEEIKRAEIEEKHAARRGAAAGGDPANPFMRVKTTVKFRHDMTGKKGEEAAKKDVDPEKKQGEGVGLLPTQVVPVKGRRGGVDDVIASMDIDIEI